MAPARTPQRVLIHVGVPKSGTSFLQNLLRTNRQRLSKAGVLYPRGRYGGMFQAAMDVTGNHERWGLTRERVEGRWAQMCARARAFQGTTVISSEFLCAAAPERITAALAELDGLEVHVIVTARDMGRQVPAEWQEGIKHGRHVRFAEFQRRILDPDRSHPHARRFWNYQDLPAVLARWGEHVPHDRVHLVTCPPAGADPGVLWRRFASVVGVDPDVATLPGSGGNPSLGVTEIDLLRRVNRASANPRSPLFRRTVKQVLIQSVLRRHSSPRVSAPAWLVPRLGDLAKQWREQVEHGGYDVVGDLDDLAPGPTAGNATNPDRVRPRQTLDLAAEVVCELLEETQQLREQVARLTQERAVRRSPVRWVWARLPAGARHVLRRLLRR